MLIWQKNGRLIQLMYRNSMTGKVQKIFKSQETNDWSGLVWAGNASTPPAANPPCGWDNELCRDDRDTDIFIIPGVLICIVITVLAIASAWRYKWFFYRLNFDNGYKQNLNPGNALVKEL